MDLEKQIITAFDDLNLSKKHRTNISGFLEELRDYHLPTYEHSIRVGLGAKQIAESMLIDPKPAFYGVLHDLGKVKIPLSTLAKTREFSSEDLEIMKAHPYEGFKMLLDEGYLFSSWIALTHHRYQQNRYPEHVPGLPVPLSDNTRVLLGLYSRIVALADFHDALKRPNDRFSETQMTEEERIELMLKLNKDQKYLLKNIYSKKILK